MDDASEGIEELKGNVRRLLRPRGRDWVAFTPPDLESLVQHAFERVAEMLDLPRRSDLERLSERLERVARALEAVARRHRRPTPSAPHEPAAVVPDRKSQTGS